MSTQPQRFCDEVLVGRGSYGRVYSAFDSVSKTRVALKRVRRTQNNEGIPCSVLREVAILKAVRSPFVITLREVVVESDHIVLVLDYIKQDLGTMLQGLNKKERLPQSVIKAR